VGIKRGDIMTSACEKLAARFDGLKRDGLQDVKLFFHNTDEVTRETVCAEVDEMLGAYAAGDFVDLVFDDSRR
jgi:hypothetical protein